MVFRAARGKQFIHRKQDHRYRGPVPQYLARPSDIPDLYSIGLVNLGSGNGITEYKNRLAKDNNLHLTVIARPGRRRADKSPENHSDGAAMAAAMAMAMAMQ